LLKPANPHDLGQAGGVVSIRFNTPNLQGCIGVTSSDTQNWQSTGSQLIPEPNSKWACLKANTQKIWCRVCQKACDHFRASHYCLLCNHGASVINDADGCCLLRDI